MTALRRTSAGAAEEEALPHRLRSVGSGTVDDSLYRVPSTARWMTVESAACEVGEERRRIGANEPLISTGEQSRLRWHLQQRLARPGWSLIPV